MLSLSMKKNQIKINSKNKINSFLIVFPSDITKERVKSIIQDFHITYLEKTSIDYHEVLNKLETYEIIILESTIDLDSEILEKFKSIKSKNNNVIDINQFLKELSEKLHITYFNNSWHTEINIEELKVDKKVELFKRIFDLILVLIMSPISIVLISIAAILIKITSKGPIFFLQTRVGKNGKPFKIVKLRTMIHNNTESYTVENDERVFKIGKYLRVLKIDELPQFYNILVGQMSLIGPRPERLEIVQRLSQENPYYEFRHLIKPGISGWAQVNDPRASPAKSFEKLEYDLYYIKNASFLLDLKIVIKTIIIILNRNSL